MRACTVHDIVYRALQVEAHRVSLDEPVAPIIDPWLTRTNGTTLGAVLGPHAAKLTARQLLQMTSGEAELPVIPRDPAPVLERFLSIPIVILLPF